MLYQERCTTLSPYRIYLPARSTIVSIGLSCFCCYLLSSLFSASFFRSLIIFSSVPCRSEFGLWFCKLQTDGRRWQSYKFPQRLKITEQNYQSKYYCDRTPPTVEGAFRWPEIRVAILVVGFCCFGLFCCLCEVRSALCRICLFQPISHCMHECVSHDSEQSWSYCESPWPTFKLSAMILVFESVLHNVIENVHEFCSKRFFSMTNAIMRYQLSQLYMCQRNN